jgi:hypothetical protein
MVLLILAICLLDKNANAFSIPVRRAPTLLQQVQVTIANQRFRTSHCMGGRKSESVQLWMEIISFDSDDDSLESSTKAAVKNPAMPVEAAVFAVGSLVSVSKKGLKAFNIPPAACGSFDKTTKMFVPSEETNPGNKYLILPVGLQGEVVRVIDPTISAKHSIQVKFEAGQQPDGFDLPAGFSYHFATDELALIK